MTTFTAVTKLEGSTKQLDFRLDRSTLYFSNDITTGFHYPLYGEVSYLCNDRYFLVVIAEGSRYYFYHGSSQGVIKNISFQERPVWIKYNPHYPQQFVLSNKHLLTIVNYEAIEVPSLQDRCFRGKIIFYPEGMFSIREGSWTMFNRYGKRVDNPLNHIRRDLYTLSDYYQQLTVGQNDLIPLVIRIVYRDLREFFDSGYYPWG